MKRKILFQGIILSLVVVSLFSSCKKRDDDDGPAPFITEIKADITKDKVLPIDTVYFSATVNMNAEIEWDFDDGTSAAGANVMHVFSQVGYYSVAARATANNKTTSASVDVNTTIYVRFRLNSVTVLAMPSTNSGGSTWDNDGVSNGNPDLFVFPDIENYTNYNSQLLANVTPGPIMSTTLPFAVAPVFSDMGSDFKISLNDDDVTDVENIATINFGAIKILLISNPTAPPTTKTVSNNGVTARLNLSWI